MWKYAHLCVCLHESGSCALSRPGGFKECYGKLKRPAREKIHFLGWLWAFGSGDSFSSLSTVCLPVTCSQLDLDYFSPLSSGVNAQTGPLTYVKKEDKLRNPTQLDKFKQTCITTPMTSVGLESPDLETHQFLSLGVSAESAKLLWRNGTTFSKHQLSINQVLFSLKRADGRQLPRIVWNSYYMWSNQCNLGQDLHKMVLTFRHLRRLMSLRATGKSSLPEPVHQ